MANITEMVEKLKKGQVDAFEVLQANLISTKQAFLSAYQRKEITREEYATAVGESVVDTLAQMYDTDMRRAQKAMKNRVEAEYITAEEYEEITGEKYAETELGEVVPAMLQTPTTLEIARQDTAAEQKPEVEDVTPGKEAE